MAGKSYLGIDIGHDQLKLAWVKNGAIKKVVSIQMPENLYKDGHIVSVEVFSNLIKGAMKENGIKEKNAAIVLSSDIAYVKNVTIPVMTADQLLYNLPYEFRDYFTEELHDYYFDYAMYSKPEDIKVEATDEDDENGATMELMGVAVKKEIISEIKDVIIKCGLKPEIIAPTASAYMNIINWCKNKKHAEDEEYCFLDLGNKTIRMNIYKGIRNTATRELESGIALVDEAVAHHFNVDVHLAHTYVIGNYENCQNCDECMEAYNTIGVGLMRALNFYQFSNPDSHLKSIYVSGGGAGIKPLIGVIKELISEYEIEDVSDILPRASAPSEIVDEGLLAIGIALV